MNTFKISNRGFCREGQKMAFGKSYKSYLISLTPFSQESRHVFVKKQISWDSRDLFYSFRSDSPRSYVVFGHRRLDKIIKTLGATPVKTFISKRKLKMKNSGVYKFYITPVV